MTSPRPSGPLECTNVRCGSDIAETLRAAGFEGRFVEFSDPVCQGPVPHTSLIEARSRFISEAFDVPPEQALSRLQRQQQDLRSTIEDEHVVLWFEDDPYDQLILARILAFYDATRPPKRLELVIHEHPDRLAETVATASAGASIGLGPLSTQELRALWSKRVPVTRQMISLGAQVWAALLDGTPAPLHRLLDSTAIASLRAMRRALFRHLQELPWRADGLSLTQRNTLRALADGPLVADRLFSQMSNVIEPLPYLGDAMWWYEVREMMNVRRAPLTSPDGDPTMAWPTARAHTLTLTPVGEALLAAEIDWVECGSRRRWLGNVAIEPGQFEWRWEPELEAPVRVALDRGKMSAP